LQLKTWYCHKKSEEEVMSLGGLFESNFERRFDDTLVSKSEEIWNSLWTAWLIIHFV